MNLTSEWLYSEDMGLSAWNNDLYIHVKMMMIQFCWIMLLNNLYYLNVTIVYFEKNVVLSEFISNRCPHEIWNSNFLEILRSSWLRRSEIKVSQTSLTSMSCKTVFISTWHWGNVIHVLMGYFDLLYRLFYLWKKILLILEEYII